MRPIPLLMSLAFLVVLGLAAWSTGPQGGELFLLCLALVLALWAARFGLDHLRFRHRARQLQGTAWQAAAGARPAVVALLEHPAVAGPLREYLLQGWPTGTGAVWPRDFWQAPLGPWLCTVFELHQTPGFQQLGLPICRQRHTGLCLQLDSPWPEFMLWSAGPGVPGPLPHPTRPRQARDRPGSRAPSLRRDQVGGCVIEAVHPLSAWAHFEPLWVGLGRPGQGLLAACTGPQLVLVFRRGELSADQLRAWADTRWTTPPAPAPAPDG